MEKGCLCKKVASSKDNLLIISSRARDLWKAKMERDTKVIGEIIKSMEMDSIFGLTEEHLKVNIDTGNEMALES